MTRIVAVIVFFVGVFAGFGLAALGVPTNVAVASGLLVTGAAVAAASRPQAVRQRIGLPLGAIGAGVGVFGAVLFVAGLTMS